MSKKKDKKHISLSFSIIVIVMIVFAFIIGTFVGFKKGVNAGVQLKMLTGCNVVDCDDLGVEAEVCEVCIDENEGFVTKMLAG